MRLSWAHRAAMAAAGALIYLGLLVPTLMRAHAVCRPGVGTAAELYALCGGLGWPSFPSFLMWGAPAPFFFLYLSSRLRCAVLSTSFLAKPRTIGSVASLIMAALGLFFSLTTHPDWSLPRGPSDTGWVIIWLLFAVYMLMLARIRTRADLEEREYWRPLDLRGLLVLASGLTLYAAIVPVEFVQMRVGLELCRPGMHCDGPVRGFLAYMVLWALGWPIFLPFVAGAARWRGFRPWYGAEVRIGTRLVALLIGAVGMLLMQIPRCWPFGLFFLVLAAWFLIVAHLCRQAAYLVAEWMDPLAPPLTPATDARSVRPSVPLGWGMRRLLR